MHKIFTMPFAQVYPHYVKKIERKGRSVKELHEVITWLTGFSEAALKNTLRVKPLSKISLKKPNYTRMQNSSQELFVV